MEVFCLSFLFAPVNDTLADDGHGRCSTGQVRKKAAKAAFLWVIVSLIYSIIVFVALLRHQNFTLLFLRNWHFSVIL